MTTIVKTKGSKGEHYYIYDYEKNPNTGKFKRKYISTATKEQYEDYIKNLDDRFKYCRVCGKKKKRYATHDIYCRCR
jgi:hypothetical protein